MLDKAKIHIWNDLCCNGDIISTQPWIPHGYRYTRWHINGLQSSQKITAEPIFYAEHSSCCRIGYNIEEDRQLYCPGCRSFRHDKHYALHEKSGSKDHEVPLHQDLKDLPMIRGGGWVTILRGLGFLDEEVHPWIWVGSLGLLELEEWDSSCTEVMSGYFTRKNAIKAFHKCAEVVEKLGSVRSWQCKECGYII